MLTPDGSCLDSAFLATGFTDVRAFLCRNALDSALQILVQLSVAALVVSTARCLLNAWLDSRAKVSALVVACVAPLMLLAGVLALSYAESLPCSSRPPLVLCGALSVLAVLCIAHPIWSSLRRRRKLALALQEDGGTQRSPARDQTSRTKAAFTNVFRKFQDHTQETSFGLHSR
jgi:hypothetical protein